MLGFDKIDAPAWMYFFTPVCMLLIAFALGDPIRWRWVVSVSTIWVTVTLWGLWPTSSTQLSAVDPSPKISVPPPVATPIPVVPAPRIFVTASLAEILAPYRTNSNNTKYQSDQLFETSKGKWMRLNLTVREVSTSVTAEKLQVFGYEDRGDDHMVGMLFGKDKADQLTHLRKGDQISVECKLFEAGATYLLANTCEMVESRTPPKKQGDK